MSLLGKPFKGPAVYKVLFLFSFLSHLCPILFLQMLSRLLNSSHPEDLRAANKLIKEMVQEVCRPFCLPYVLYSLWTCMHVQRT